jgi:hypothetical protein
MLTLMLSSWSPESIVVGSDEAVAISLAAPRKGTAKFPLHRAPFDLWLHQMTEGVEALLLSSMAGSVVVRSGGLLRLPAARVSVMATKRRRTSLWLPSRIYTTLDDRRREHGQPRRPGRGAPHRAGVPARVDCGEDEDDNASSFLSG